MRIEQAPILLVLVFACLAPAQESASYKLDEHTLNAGGNPSGVVVLTSASYKISLDAIGDSVAGRNLASTSYRMDGSFVMGYPPPGEVHDLNFTDFQTLVWQHEKSTGVYNLYRGLFSGLDGTVYGSCAEPDIAVNTTTDSDPVPAGNGHFYLVTAENRLAEEGTLGYRSSGEERFPTSMCP
jgi:hypothetical protein